MTFDSFPYRGLPLVLKVCHCLSTFPSDLENLERQESLFHLFEMEIDIFLPLFTVVLQCQVLEQELELFCAWNVTPQFLSRSGAYDRD